MTRLVIVIFSFYFRVDSAPATVASIICASPRGRATAAWGIPCRTNLVRLPSHRLPSRDTSRRKYDTVTSSRGILILKSWLPTRIRKSNKRPELPEPDRVPKKLSRPTEHQPRCRSPGVEATNEGSSWMAAAGPKRVSASLIDIPMWCM